jgi:1-acyl-sn-glycerol-3-phosphate acyltransferase
MDVTPPLSPPAIDLDLGEVGRRYWAVRRATAPIRRLWFDVDCEAIDNVPASGGVILAANHLSFIDSVLLMYSLPRRVTFLGKAEYISKPATRRLFPAAGMIPVDRSGRGVGRSLAEACSRLDDGEVIGIFPEGTRSRDGDLHAGHPGVAHLALKTGVPILPVGLLGTDAAMPADSRGIKRNAPITIRFGAPVDLGPWTGERPVARVKREITDEVMESIAGLTGQVYAGAESAVWLTAETIARSEADTIDSCKPTPHTTSRAPVSTAT